MPKDQGNHKLIVDGVEIVMSDDQMNVAQSIAEYPLLPKALELVCTEQKASTSFIQRKLAIGYNKAARLIEEMERYGWVSEPDHIGKRTIQIQEIPTDFKVALEASTALAALIAEKYGEIIDPEGEITRSTHMKETDADRDVAEKTYRVTRQELSAFIERAEAQQIRIDEETAAKNEIFAEAKGRGYDLNALKEVIKIRKADRDKRAELTAVTRMYLDALGMDSDVLL